MTRKLFHTASIIIVCFLMTFCYKKSIPHNTSANNQRILGYLSGSRNWQKAFSSVDLTNLTDLNLAFFNPDSNGILPPNADLPKLIATAHQKNIRVYMSIGGGNGPAYLKDLIAGSKRTQLINTIVSFALANHFDGVDVDLENDLITDQYAGFVAELSAALKTKHLLMTAALASWNADLIKDETLRLYDFINIMSYDKTGPWNLNKPGPHSPLSMAQDDFAYFNTKRSIPASRLLIGLPFYGYGFGGKAPESLAYKEIIARYPGAENKDEIELADGGHLYYNGIPTIRQKCAFAKANKAAGVMIWELQQDSQDENSLLKTIAKALN